MTNTEIKSGSKVTTVSGKVYTATGRTYRMSGSIWLDIEPTEDNDFKRSIEIRCIASVA